MRDDMIHQCCSCYPGWRLLLANLTKRVLIKKEFTFHLPAVVITSLRAVATVLVRLALRLSDQ